MEDVAGDLPVSDRLAIPATELRWRFSHGSGPGGQSVNTSDSRVELSWHPGSSAALTDVQRDRVLARLAGRLTGPPDDPAIVVRAAESRSQWQNRRAARLRLAELIRRALLPPPRTRRRTRPTRGSVERRLADKRRRAQVKHHRGHPGPSE